MSLERIEITPFAVIAGDILQNRRTGDLTIVRGPLRKVLYWSQGELVLVASANPDDSLAAYLVQRGALPADKAMQIGAAEPAEVVARFHEIGGLDLSVRQSLLRDWMAAQFLPLFSLDEGTAAFTDADALDPDKRVFLQSTAVLILEGIRSITNGLVLRRSLGDLKREIEPGRDARVSLDALPLTDAERQVAQSLRGTSTIEGFLKGSGVDTVSAARVVIAMIALGVFGFVDYSRQQPEMRGDDMQRDLELLAAIGASDQRSLRAVALSRQLAQLDHYQVLDVPRAATRQQILTGADLMQRLYDPATYPPIVRDSVQTIRRRVDEALAMLKDPVKRQEYDRLLQQRSARGADELQKRVAQRSIAEHNFAKARELSVAGDYYGAIVLLKQAVEFSPDHSQAWFLLGSCQERNPKWHRAAAESYQRALAIDPNFVDALISLGDLYRSDGLTSRAQACYDDVLKISPDNQEAKRRLQALKKR
ncbi:MAG TPA: tetratricopeptide repeat protein [Thermoanaerobaculia bacterium]